MKPHIKVIQRNGVDIFVTSSMADKLTVSEQRIFNTPMNGLYADGTTVGQGWLQEAAAEIVGAEARKVMEDTANRLVSGNGYNNRRNAPYTLIKVNNNSPN